MPGWACDRQGAGALLDLVTIQRLKSNATVSDLGETLQHENTNWETHCQEWSEVHFLSGDESGQPTQQVALRAWALRVRWHATTLSITSLMRVVLPTGQTLQITGTADPDRLRRWIEISAKETAS